MSSKSTLFKYSTLLLFAVILVIGYRQKNELFFLLKDIKFDWLLVGLMFYFLNYITRAYRLQLLVGKKQYSFRVALKISSLHGFYSYFLPIRSGDISLPLLLNRYTSLPLVSGASILLRARLLDLFSLGVLLFYSTVLSRNILDEKVYYIFLLASLVLLCSPFLIKIVVSTGMHFRAQWLKSFAEGVTMHRLTVKQTSLSLVIWLWTGCTLFAATRALTIPIQFMEIWFLVAIQLPIQLFPIQGVANTGNHEVGWVTGFALLGISPQKALEFALASHVIIIIYVFILGAIGFILPNKSKTSHSSTRA